MRNKCIKLITVASTIRSCRQLYKNPLLSLKRNLLVVSLTRHQETDTHDLSYVEHYNSKAGTFQLMKCTKNLKSLKSMTL